MYMLAFTFILIALLWILQTVYLEKFYKLIKMNEADNALENVISVINDDEIEEAIHTIGNNYDISIALVDENGQLICLSGEENANYIGFINVNKRAEFFKNALENDGEYVINNFMESADAQQNDMWQVEPDKLEGNPFEDRFDKHNDNRFDMLPNMPKQVESSSVLKVCIAENSANENIGVFVYSVISPVGATVQTLRIQLVCISFIMILLAFVLALIMSWRISKPIVEINKTAKEMAEGRYDITFKGNGYLEVRELSDTLNYTAVELSKTEKLQKELIANVSHDLRTPLTMITAYAEVMRDIPGESTPENIQVIIDEAGRLSLLVNDLLDISKIQAGFASCDKKEYNLTLSIEQAVDRIRKLVEKEGYTISFNYEDDVYVCADEGKMYQVIYNLINNAIAYSEEDRNITVNQICVGNLVRIEVVDRGKGITKEELPNVWDRYYKVDKNHKRAISGTGLGLSIVKNILAAHEARYGIISKEGEGSTFWFEIGTI